MPAASSSSASAKRKQDEKHYNILKELLAQDCNKKCFDCGQRGPVYVNMTIGAFVCTSCSGLLRGMNTPHRVKSVSMASFTPEEMDFIQKRGNDACYCVWMGRYEASRKFGGGDAFPESKDEHRLREYMHKKYEQKKWYVSEATALAEYEQIRQKSLAAQKPTEKSKTTSKPHIPVPVGGSLSQKQVSKSSSNDGAVKCTPPKENKPANTAASNSNDLDLIFGTGPSEVGPAPGSSNTATNSQTPKSAKPSSQAQPKDPFAADPFSDNGASQNDFDPFTSFQSNSNTMKSEQSEFAAFPSSSVPNSFVADFGEMKMSTPVSKTKLQNSLSPNDSMSSVASVIGSAVVKEDKYAILASLDEEMKSSVNRTSWSENMTVKRDPVVPSNQGFGASYTFSQNGSNYPLSWNSQTLQVSGITQFTGSPAVYSSGGFPNSDMAVNPFGGPLQGSQTSTTSAYAAFGNFSSPQFQQPSNIGSAHVPNPFLESSWGGVHNARPDGTNNFQFSQPFGAPMTAVGNSSMTGGVSNFSAGAPISQSPFGNNPNTIHQHAISTGAPKAMTNGAAFSNISQFNVADQTFGTQQGFTTHNSTISSPNFPGQQQPPTSNFNAMNSPFSVQPNSQNLGGHQPHQPMNNDWSRTSVSQGLSPVSLGQPPAVDPFASLATGMKSSVQLFTVTTKSPNPWPNQTPSMNPSVNSAAAMKANPFLD